MTEIQIGIKEKLEDIASCVRRDILRMVHGAQSGHPGGSLGAADILTCLYFHFMKHDIGKGIVGDVFYLSNGHISPLLYSVLARFGSFETEELGTFRKINSRLQGHPANHYGIDGIRISTGSLGQGLSVAIGTALSNKMDENENLVYCMVGDGELQEGQNWEAMMFAAHHRVDNLILCVDYNRKQIDGDTRDVMNLGNLRDKLESFGWYVLETDGNDMFSVMEIFHQAQSEVNDGRPVAIIFHTQMGYPIDFMMGTHKWHGVAPNDEQLEKALSQLNTTLPDY